MSGRNADGRTAKLPAGELFETIDLLSQAIGMLDCLEVFEHPNIDLNDFALEAHVRSMALAAGGASKLVTQAQAFLIEADVIEPEVSHG